MITEDKDIEIYALADDFCKVFSRQLKKYQLEAPKITLNYHRHNKLSDFEVITIPMLFHLKGYRWLKKFYLEHVCVYMRDVFPKLVSHNRFIELQQSACCRPRSSSKKCYWANVRVFLSSARPLCVCANNLEYTPIKYFKVSPPAKNHLSDGSLTSNFI